MKFHQVILYGSRVMLIFAKCLHFFNERSDDKQGEYRANYVHRFLDLHRAVQSVFHGRMIDGGRR